MHVTALVLAVTEIHFCGFVSGLGKSATAAGVAWQDHEVAE